MSDARLSVPLLLPCLNLPFSLQLLNGILSLQIAGQGAHKIHQIPNLIRGFDLTQGRHPGEADSVLYDPKRPSPITTMVGLPVLL
jgi:hypothetical protein